MHPYRTHIRMSGIAVSRTGGSQARVGCAEHSVHSREVHSGRSPDFLRGFGGDGSESGLASPDCPDFFARKTAPLPEWTLDWENG